MLKSEAFVPRKTNKQSVLILADDEVEERLVPRTLIDRRYVTAKRNQPSRPKINLLTRAAREREKPGKQTRQKAPEPEAQSSSETGLDDQISLANGYVLHALLEDGELPGKLVSVRRVAHGAKLRAAGLPGQGDSGKPLPSWTGLHGIPPGAASFRRSSHALRACRVPKTGLAAPFRPPGAAWPRSFPNGRAEEPRPDPEHSFLSLHALLEGAVYRVVRKQTRQAGGRGPGVPDLRAWS